MEINNLEMISFRNHDKTNISFNSGLTIIWGENGSGKTSILEAIHSLSLGKSFRTNNRKELIKEGKESFLLKGLFKNNRGVKNRVLYFQDIFGNKRIKANEKNITKRKDLLGLNNVVVFSPEEETITKGPPKERRQFFNKVFSICSKKYLNLLLHYNRIIKQRNAILKNKKNRKETEKELSPWSEPLSTTGQNLWNERVGLLSEFNGVFKLVMKELDKNLKLKIIYNKEQKDKNSFLAKTKTNEGLDIKNGFTSYGPHKDDFLFLWKEKTIRKHGSQGEHKLFLALLKITELVFLSQKTKKSPIFLIDDLFASLDKKRSKKLLRFINKIQPKKGKKPQTIITTTDLLDLEKNGFFLGFENIKKHRLKKQWNT